MSIQQEIRRLTAPDIRARKNGEPIVTPHLVSLPVPPAWSTDTCDVILVGDSLGMVCMGSRPRSR